MIGLTVTDITKKSKTNPKTYKDALKREDDAPIAIVLSFDEFGDVKFQTNSDDMDIGTAIMMMELTKSRLLASHMQGVFAEREKAKTSKSILKPTSTIIRP